MASAQLFASVPFYAGLTLEEIGGRGVRWQARDAASAFGEVETDLAHPPFELEAPPAPAVANGRLRLGTFRSIWASPEVEASPALAFLHPRQRIEISPQDAERLKVFHGDRVVVGSNGHSVNATVTLRAATPEGTVFLETAIPDDSGFALDGPLVEVRKA